MELAHKYLVGSFIAGILLAYIGNRAEIPFWMLAITALVYGWYLGSQQRRREKNAKADTDMHT